MYTRQRYFWWPAWVMAMASAGLCQHCERVADAADKDRGHPLFVTVTLNTTESCKEYRLYLATYATNISRADFCIAAASAISYKFQINVIGTSRQDQFKRFGPLDKLWALEDFVSRLPDHPNVLLAFIDAYDTIANGSPRALVLRLLASGHSILFASEKGCCGTKWQLMGGLYHCDSDWPPPPVATRTPFLNSGVFVGFRTEVAALLQLAAVEFAATAAALRPDQKNPYTAAGDQQLICHIFSYGVGDRSTSVAEREAVRARLGLAIDYTDLAFKCLHNVNLLRETAFTAGGRFSARGTADGEWTYPVVLHFNGPGETKTRPLRFVSRRIRIPVAHWAGLQDAPLWREDGGDGGGGGGGTLGGVCGGLVERCGKRAESASDSDSDSDRDDSDLDSESVLACLAESL